MRVQPTLPVSWRGGPPASVKPLVASEKPSNSALSGQERRDTPREPRRRAPHPQAEQVCQGGTAAHGPFRDGPRLTPAFVTQLLGQVMAGGQRPAAPPAYGVAEPKTALLFDARV
jgi:hypothetical protein